MKLFRLVLFFLVGALMSSGVWGQSNATLNILTLNSGQVSVGGTVDVQVTVGNTGPTTAIGVRKVRAQISIPIAIASALPSPQQTGLPSGWEITANTGGVITVCNGTDIIPVGVQRQILIKVQGTAIGGPSTINGSLIFSNGTSCTVPGTLPGDNTADNTGTTSIQVLAATGCNLAVTASAGIIPCNGGTTTLTATATGGTGALQYSLNGGAFQSGNTFTINAAGSPYTVVAREVGTPTCTATSIAVTVTQPSVVTASATSTPVTTTGGTDGTATVTAAGGTAPYTYSWNTTPVQTTATATGLSAGSYSVTVTDANGCTATATTTVGSPSCNLLVSASAGTIACNGGTTTLTATATGGTGALQYSLNGGAFQSGNTFTVGAGTYTVTVREVANPTCTATSIAVTVTQPSVVTASATSTPVTTTGGTDGTATVTAAGGTAPYTYSWNTTPVQTTATATGLSAGSYSVTVTDANGCTATATTTVGSPSCNLLVSASAGTIACNGGTTTLTATATGGTGALQYSLNGGAFQSGNTFTVGAGTYTVTVREVANPACTATSPAVTVTQPSVVTASATSTPVTTTGGTDGTATVTAAGGTAPYTYSWNTTPVQTTATATGLSAGSYSVTVTDANGCTATATTTVGSPSCNLLVSASAGTIACNGGTTTLTATATGGTGALQYSLNGGAFQSGNTFTVGAGTYTVTVRETANPTCIATASTLTITQPVSITATLSAGTIGCNGGTTTLTVTATGGTGALQYSLNGGAFQSGNTFTVVAGTYTVTVRDANLCTTTTSAVTIVQPAAITATSSAGTIGCNGGTTTLTVTATGGTGALQYSLNGGAFQSGNTFTVVAGTYTVTVRDANLCTTTTSAVTVVQPAAITATLSAGTIGCNGGTTTLTVTATGGTGALQYSLNGGAFQSGNTFTVVAGTYTVTVRDANLCTTTTSTVTIVQPAAITASASAGAFACSSVTTTLTVTATGGTGVLEYSLNGGAFQSGNTFTVGAGSYTVTVRDANLCTATTATVTVVQPSLITALASAGTIACNGGTTTLTITATGGTGALQYSLNGGTFQSSNIFTVGAGSYTVTVRDANLCTATTATVTVIQPASITVSASASAFACNSGTTTLAVTATGGTGVLQYSLNGGTFQSANTFTVGAGSYTVIVRDANLCTRTITVAVTQPATLRASATAKRITQCGGTTSITVTASGGIPPYSSGIGSFTRGPGTWAFLITDAAGCTTTTQIIVEAPGCIELKVFPNPVTNAITINHSTAETGSVVQVYGINGALLISKHVVLNSFLTTIDVSRLAAGSYVIVYLNGNEKKTLLFEKITSN